MENNLEEFDHISQKALERQAIWVDYITKHLPRIIAAMTTCNSIIVTNSIFMGRFERAAHIRQQLIIIQWEVYLHEQATKEFNEKWYKEEVKW